LYAPTADEPPAPEFSAYPSLAGLDKGIAEPTSANPDAQERQRQSTGYFQAAFPRVSNDASQWLMSKPSLWKFDRVVINDFINIFVRQVPQTLISFFGFSIDEMTLEEEVLAVAAMGGLYSMTSGSHIMARAMCGDARRLMLTRVSPSSFG
jgi:hypothetical protein